VEWAGRRALVGRGWWEGTGGKEAALEGAAASDREPSTAHVDRDGEAREVGGDKAEESRRESVVLRDDREGEGGR
jgi:hypothetical protein